MNDPDVTALRAAQERDEAECVRWWRETTDAAKSRIWDTIQAMGGPDDPTAEIISRFAQLGYTHAALLAAREDQS